MLKYLLPYHMALRKKIPRTSSLQRFNRWILGTSQHSYSALEDDASVLSLWWENTQLPKFLDYEVIKTGFIVMFIITAQVTLKWPSLQNIMLYYLVTHNFNKGSLGSTYYPVWAAITVLQAFCISQAQQCGIHHQQDLTIGFCLRSWA